MPIIIRSPSTETMYRTGRTSRSDTFSSTLLDKIYRSIDELDAPIDEPGSGKQGKCSARSRRFAAQDPQIGGIIRACLAGDMAQGRQISPVLEGRVKADEDFFSSNASSSDSSSSGFSSSDVESIYGLKQKISSFVPPPVPRPKPVRTEKSTKPEKMAADRKWTLFQERRRTAPPPVDVHHRHHPSTEEAQVHQVEGISKSKSRALKIYENLKKVKQPISPGSRLSSFINSLFASGNVKKPKSHNSSGQASTCLSASSVSRSCLSRSTPGARRESPDGARRTVQFYPVSVIVDEDLKPCGHKCLYQQEESAPMISVQVPGNRRAGRSPGRKAKTAEEVAEKPRSVEKVAREFLRDYHWNQRRYRSSPWESYRGHGYNDTYTDDDASSCSSSDLFELDHLRFISSDSRFCEDLPVYETTRVGRNLAIANGLVV